MAYRLRFIQRFDKKDSEAFLRLERKFMELEQEENALIVARRFVPITGKEPTNTLIWEADLPSMEDVISLMNSIEQDSSHDKLLEEQIVFMTDYYVEILREISL